MSAFSELLSNFIVEKNADVSQMVRYCGYDRSTMYKILKGKRNPPSLDMVFRIGHFLRLTQPELQHLMESWQLTILGPLKYYRRKSVEHFLRSFPDDFTSIREDVLLRSVPALSHGQISDAPSCLALDSQMEINSFLRQIIIKEIEHGQGSISLLVQPDYDYLFQTLGSLSPDNPLSVDHIFCLSNTEALTSDHQLLHIRYLETLFPLFTRKNIGYTPLYYHGDVHTRFNTYNLMPCMILTTEYAILCTSDFQNGIFFNDPTVRDYLQQCFDSLKKQCSALFRILSADLQEFEQILGLNHLIKPGTPAYIIQAEGVLFPFLRRETILSMIDPSVSNREELTEHYTVLLERSCRALSDPSWMHQFFTRNGLLFFARTGRFRELPSDLCRPVSPEDRIRILKQFKEYCKSGVFRMLRSPLEQLSSNLRLAITGKIGYLVMHTEDCPLIYMLFNETFMVEIFRDYMESLEEFCCYSVEETLEAIQEMIDSL